MKPFVTTIAIDIDARRELLLHIKKINPDFFGGLYARIQDKLTYGDLAKALIEELAVHDITFVIDETLTIYLAYKAGLVEMLEKHDDYDSALQFAVALLRVRPFSV